MTLLQAMYKWNLKLQFLIKKNFTHRARPNYRGIMDQTHNGLLTKREWMRDHIFTSFQQKWENEYFKKKHELNKKNKASATSGSLHISGFDLDV